MDNMYNCRMYTAARLSDDIYDDDFRDRWTDGGTNVGIFGHSETVDTPFGVVYSKYTTYVVFRGTDSVSDLLTNAAIKMRFLSQVCPGMVHSGFGGAYLKMRDLIYDHISENIGDDCKEIVICGHSKGGAVAQLFFADCKRNNLFDKSEIYCYTFGSPRVGDKVFAKFLNKQANLYRVVLSNDIVTRVPILLGKYRHAGRLYYYSFTGRLKINAPVLYMILNFIISKFLVPRRLTCINDHGIKRYLKVINCKLAASRGA